MATGAKQWIKGAEANGWRVGQISGLRLKLVCGLHGCTGHRLIDLSDMGEPPAPCDLQHARGYSRRVFDGYTALVEELAQRRRRLGLDQTDLNDAMGMADGYISKLESYARIASTPTLQTWCDTLGVRFTISPAPLPDATLRAIERRQAAPYNPKRARSKHDRQQA